MAMTKKNLAIQAAKAAAAKRKAGPVVTQLTKTTKAKPQPRTVAALLSAPEPKRKRAPGAGRPEVSPDLQLFVCSFRANKVGAAKFKALGGGKWARPLLEKAVLPRK